MRWYLSGTGAPSGDKKWEQVSADVKMSTEKPNLLSGMKILRHPSAGTSNREYPSSFGFLAGNVANDPEERNP